MLRTWWENLISTPDARRAGAMPVIGPSVGPSGGSGEARCNESPNPNPAPMPNPGKPSAAPRSDVTPAPSWAFPGYTRATLERTVSYVLAGESWPDSLLDHTQTYYISGPMKGYPSMNFPLFRKCCDQLDKKGLSLLSPHLIEHDTYGSVTPEDYLRWDLVEMLQGCDGIILIGKWLDSWGAGFEFNVAAKLNFDIFLYDDEQDLLFNGEALRQYVH